MKNITDQTRERLRAAGSKGGRSWYDKLTPEQWRERHEKMRRGRTRQAERARESSPSEEEDLTRDVQKKMTDLHAAPCISARW